MREALVCSAVVLFGLMGLLGASCRHEASTLDALEQHVRVSHHRR